MNDGKPTLIQLDISHYSEKVRWALDYKQVPHVRRSPLPGSHMPIAFALTRGESITLPPTRCRAGGRRRRVQRPPRLPLGRRDVPPPSLSGAVGRSLIGVIAAILAKGV